MADTAVAPVTEVLEAGEPSFADLRASLAGTAPTKPVEAQPVTSEKAAEATPAAEETLKTAPETVETKPATEEAEEPLPENVQKKIAKEDSRTVEIQRKIDQAVSARKAKEAELASVTGKSGSEPATNTEPEKNAKPKRPTLPPDIQFGAIEGQTWGEFQDAKAKRERDHEAALAEYDTKRETWLVSETRKQVEEEFRSNEAKKVREARWDTAVKEHGKDFPALVDKIRETAPDGLQTAIGALRDWASVAAHLGKNPAKLKDLVAEFAENQYEAIATLGRIQAGLQSAAKPAVATVAATEKPLPDPPATPGGKASTSAAAFDYENASPAQIRARMKTQGVIAA